MKQVLVFLVIFFLLAGCAPSPAAQIPISPTPPFKISTAVPTIRPQTKPANTLRVLETTNPSPTVSSVTNLTATAIEFVQQECATRGLEEKASPDGKWLASSCLDNEDAHVRIARYDGEKSLDLYFRDITGASPCVYYTNQYSEQACFYGVLYINHWYKDGRYVFVDADFLVDRAGNFHYGLYRIDSETGKISPYLPLNGYTYNYAFSPDDEHYAYATGSDNYLLHVVSIETGENIPYVVPGRYEDIGDLLWSPDNKKLTIVTPGIRWYDRPEIGWSLVLLDLETGKFTTLIEEEGYRLTPQKWLSDDTLLLSGRDINGQDYHDYQLTISTNALLPLPDATPTP